MIALTLDQATSPIVTLGWWAGMGVLVVALAAWVHCGERQDRSTRDPKTGRKAL